MNRSLKNGVKKAPDKIPAFLARNMNLFSYDKEKKQWSWSSFALFLFDEYGKQRECYEVCCDEY